MPHVGLLVLFTPAEIPAKLAEDGKKVLEPAHQPDPVAAMITKVHSETCVNLVVIEDGDYAGQRHTSVCSGLGPFSFKLQPRTFYESPYRS